MWGGLVCLVALAVGVAVRAEPAHVGATRRQAAPPDSGKTTTPPEDVAHAVPQPFRMLFVGASITAGVGATAPAQSFPYLLGTEIARALGPTQTTVMAIPGAPVSAALLWDFPTDQNLIVVHLATNDYLQNTPVPLYRSELETLLRRLRAGSPHATLVCLGAWAASGAPNGEGVTPAAYNAADSAACGSVRGHFLGLQSLFGQTRLHDPLPLGASGQLPALPGIYHVGDKLVGFHPSDAGDAAIAQAIYGVLERVNSLEPVSDSS
jgi:lysophospholipase L1-like esterase